jgi:GTP-binding protein
MITVPPGSVILDAVTGAVLRDLTSPAETWVAVRGGIGGRGNARFTNSRDQAPRIAESGESGRMATVRVELKSLTDIGLVGMPNAGKSTLLAALTNARPAAAPYPFTTTVVTLGTMELSDRHLVIADLPGILRGSANGKGLGLAFLKHVARSHLLIFLIDLSEENGGDSYVALRRELQAFDPGLSRKHHLIVASKSDLDKEGVRLAALENALENVEVCAVSAESGEGIHRLKEVLAIRVPE